MIVCCLCAYGCSENDPYGGLVGKWQDESDDHVIAEFRSDGTYGTLENGSFSQEGTYSVSGNKITLDSRKMDMKLDGTYSINDDRLVMNFVTGTFVYKRIS